MGGDPGMEGDIEGEIEPELDLDNIGDELEGDEDDLAGAEDMSGEEPLGRAMKESTLQRKVMEMQKLVAKARKLKEARK